MEWWNANGGMAFLVDIFPSGNVLFFFSFLFLVCGGGVGDFFSLVLESSIKEHATISP